MKYRFVFTRGARRRLDKLPRTVAQSIAGKIRWLAAHTEEIRHERMKGHEEYSLHVGQYRVLYTIDRESRCIYIEDVGKHNEAYRRLRER